MKLIIFNKYKAKSKTLISFCCQTFAAVVCRIITTSPHPTFLIQDAAVATITNLRQTSEPRYCRCVLKTKPQILLEQANDNDSTTTNMANSHLRRRRDSTVGDNRQLNADS